ncbi:MAG: TetR/AcrR family transcriptional regulator [Myxococcota bacterium]|nr:TetR/AcrR family transcriptional regulator [Myxococcota bacterium]
MPPKPRFDRDTVLDAAMEVARRDGFAAVTARSVAKALGASTAPVTSYFDNMESLGRAVVGRVVEALIRRISETEGEDPLHVAAFAMARFAADEPRLYEALFLVPHAAPPDWVALRRGFAEGMGEAPRYAALSTRDRDAVAWRASVVTHGICIEVWSGRWAKTSDAALRRLVADLVEPVVARFLAERA